MGCAVSRYERIDAVSLCQERKDFLKLAIERRRGLADEHGKYVDSFLAVAAAIRLFVDRHTSPSSPFLLTLHPPISQPMDDPSSNLLLLPQKQSEEEIDEATTCHSTNSSFLSEEMGKGLCKDDDEDEDDDDDDNEDEEVCPYFYDLEPSPMSSPHNESKWNSFDQFDGARPKEVGGSQVLHEENLRAVRQEEGIPELEEEQETDAGEGKGKGAVVADEDSNETGVEVGKLKHCTNVSPEDKEDKKMVKIPERGRDLLQALKEVEDCFVKSSDTVRTAKILGTNKVHLQPSLEDVKGNSPKLEQAIRWSWSTLSRSSSSKSLLSPSFKKSSNQIHIKNVIPEKQGGMEPDSHLLTLERLYTWEKKLCKEVKAGQCLQKIYERECAKLGIPKDRETSIQGTTESYVNGLYARILVSIQTAETISNRIQNLRDEEFQTQLIELLEGLMETWMIMLETHEKQNGIMLEVKSFVCPSYGKFCEDSHRKATLQLETEFQNWHTCFVGYFAAQKAYVEALNGWLSRFNIPEVEFYSRTVSFVPPNLVRGPPLLMICRDWLESLKRLPGKAVTFSMKSFVKEVRVLWIQQGREQQQKMKVDTLTKELDQRVVTLQKAESKMFEPKQSKQKDKQDMQQEIDHLDKRTNLLDKFRKKLVAERNKHHTCMQETQKIASNGIQTGLSSIFKSLTEFSKASLEMYNELVSYSENALGETMSGNLVS
ncbi:hypothetical protein IFM89_025572 [Coptis chinensis]|uniref:Nitrate regulatory gene2 protein n=1 Tax=Coptis chinensis TaxID=261450 RepID=A0A835IPC9_9MAGN|nr:hypothetical protein IFM89_025572 [Coptis chinensis]